MDHLPAYFMTFQNLGSLELEEQAVNAHSGSYTDQETAGRHRKVRNPERETKGCRRLLGTRIGFQDDQETVPADDRTESQGQDPVEHRQDPADLHGETFNEQSGRNMPPFLRQTTGGNEDGPNDHVDADFLSPIRSRMEDIPHDDAVKGKCYSG